LRKRRIIWATAILAMFVLVMLYVVKTCDSGRRLSELDVERQYSRDMSVSVTGTPILPLKGNETNVTDADIRQNHLQANDQPRLSTDLENMAHPQICASEWLDDGLTVQEMLLCVEGDVGRKNSSQEG